MTWLATQARHRRAVPLAGGVQAFTGIDQLEYTEKVVGETLAQAVATYDAHWERVYKFATLVAGGGGAVGSYAFGKIGPGTVLQWGPLLAVSVWLFLVAGVGLIRGAAANELMLGTNAAEIRHRLIVHRKAAVHESDPDTVALWTTRWENLASVDQQIDGYARGATHRARILDQAFLLVGATPFIAAMAYLLLQR